MRTIHELLIGTTIKGLSKVVAWRVNAENWTPGDRLSEMLNFKLSESLFSKKQRTLYNSEGQYVKFVAKNTRIKRYTSCLGGRDHIPRDISWCFESIYVTLVH